MAIIAALKTPLAHSELGATRWIKLGPVSFQAAEPIKAATIIFFAYYVSYWGLNRWYNQLLAVPACHCTAGIFCFSSNNLKQLSFCFVFVPL